MTAPEGEFRRVNSCPKCGHVAIYFRKYTKTYRCQACGAVFPRSQAVVKQLYSLTRVPYHFRKLIEAKMKREGRL